MSDGERSSPNVDCSLVVIRRLALAALVLVVVSAAGAAVARSTGAAPHSPAAARPVSFVPLGSYPRSDAAALARFVARRLGLSASVAPTAALPRSAFDRARKQYVAQELMGALRRPVGDTRVVIGLTVKDMYTQDRPEWRFAFSTRSTSGFAIVSRARMDPRFLGLTPDRGLRTRRLQKMVLKTIGVLALGYSQSSNPRSVLYDSILGVDDLDYMTHEFRPAAPTGAKRAWLTRTDKVCARGISEAKALIARSRVATRDEFLALARKGIVLEARQRQALAAIPPAPSDRSAVRALLALFARGEKADRAAVAKLSASWSDAVLQSWVEESLRLGLALKSKALELGSRACGRYFDPATYAG